MLSVSSHKTRKNLSACNDEAMSKRKNNVSPLLLPPPPGHFKPHSLGAQPSKRQKLEHHVKGTLKELSKLSTLEELVTAQEIPTVARRRK